MKYPMEEAVQEYRRNARNVLPPEVQQAAADPIAVPVPANRAKPPAIHLPVQREHRCSTMFFGPAPRCREARRHCAKFPAALLPAASLANQTAVPHSTFVRPGRRMNALQSPDKWVRPARRECGSPTETVHRRLTSSRLVSAGI